MSIAQDEMKPASAQNEISVECISCGRRYSTHEAKDACDSCGSLLEVRHPLEALRGVLNREWIEQRRAQRDFPNGSGVWRWRELVAPFPSARLVTRNEGHTNLYED